MAPHQGLGYHPPQLEEESAHSPVVTGWGSPLSEKQAAGVGGGLQQHPLPGATHRSVQGLWGCHRP